MSINADEDIRIEKNINGEETYVFDPYNPLNKLISVEKIEEIMAKYNVPYKVHNNQLYKRAFIHKSYLKRPELENKQNNIVIADKPDDCIDLFTKSNERPLKIICESKKVLVERPIEPDFKSSS